MSRSDFKQFDERDFVFRNSKGKAKPAPQLPAGVPVADTHVHLNMLPDPGLAIARAAHHGLRFLCCMTDPAEEPQALGEDSTIWSAAEAYAAAQSWLDRARSMLDEMEGTATPLPRLRFACGVHPHNARLWHGAREELLELLHDPLTCCLGEIGLDYHYDFSPREDQRAVFAEQLRLAHETGLPVSLHLREAHGDALQILRQEGVPQAGCILHCFNLGPQELAPFLELGCYVALGGPLTFRKSWYTRLACRDVPVERLLTETDAPYMAPEPLRGTECEPAQTVYTLRMLLDCFGFAGQERAQEIAQPRAIDIENGAVAPKLGVPPQPHMDEGAFAEQVYRNAVDLLDRAPTAWQVGRT